MLISGNYIYVSNSKGIDTYNSNTLEEAKVDLPISEKNSKVKSIKFQKI
jgi:hypothetical protein